MTEATRIRAQSSGDKAQVRVLMSHEMENGQRKDAAGKLVPAWYIQEAEVSLNGKPVFTLECGTAMSRNPFLVFTVRGARAADKVAVMWRDSKGVSRVDEALVL